MAQLKTLQSDTANGVYLSKENHKALAELGITTVQQLLDAALRKPEPIQPQVSCRSDCPWVPDVQCPIKGKVDYTDLTNEKVLKVCHRCPSHIRYVKEIKEAPTEPHNKNTEAREDKFRAHYQPKTYPVGKCDNCGKENTLYPFKAHDGGNLQLCRSCKWKAEQVNA